MRNLTHSVHAPANGTVRTKLIVCNWDGLWAHETAAELGCHPETVRVRLHACNERGFDGLGMKPGSGRKPRHTQLERSTLLALARRLPLGKSTCERTGALASPDPDAEAEWTLGTLTAAARELGDSIHGERRAAVMTEQHVSTARERRHEAERLSTS